MKTTRKIGYCGALILTALFSSTPLVFADGGLENPQQLDPKSQVRDAGQHVKNARSTRAEARKMEAEENYPEASRLYQEEREHRKKASSAYGEIRDSAAEKGNIKQAEVAQRNATIQKLKAEAAELKHHESKNQEIIKKAYEDGKPGSSFKAMIHRDAQRKKADSKRDKALKLQHPSWPAFLRR